MDRIRGDDNRIQLQQFFHVFGCECTCTAETRFFAVRDQGAEFRVIVADIIVCHFLQEAHRKITAGKVVICAVNDGTPVDKEEQWGIQNGIDDLNDRKYVKYPGRQEVRQRQITEEEVHDPVKKRRPDTEINQRSREMLEYRHFIRRVRMTAEDDAALGRVLCLAHHIEVLSGPLRIQFVGKRLEQNIFHDDDRRRAYCQNQ